MYYGPEGDAEPVTNSLGVIDLSDVGTPVLLGLVRLSTDGLQITDVLLREDQAFGGLQSGTFDRGKVLVVGLTNEANPRVVGEIDGVGGRLALGAEGSLLFSTTYSSFGTFATEVCPAFFRPGSGRRGRQDQGGAGSASAYRLYACGVTHPCRKDTLDVRPEVLQHGDYPAAP